MSYLRRSPISHLWLLAYPLPTPLLIYLANPVNLEQATLPPITLRLTLLHTLSVGLVGHALLELLGPQLRRQRKLYRVPLYFALMQISVLLGLIADLPIANKVLPFAERHLLFGWYVAAIYTTAFGTLALSIETLWARSRDSTRKAKMEEQARKTAEYEALQARCSSHFLFNSLNTLAGLIREDAQAAEEMTVSLSSLMRYSLRGIHEPLVAITDELGSVKDYLHIQSTRFGARLAWSINLSQSAETATVPVMSIQPIVENSVLHGFSGGVDSCVVAVTITRQDGRLHISVRDEGPGPGNSKHQGTRTSLSGLQARLDFLYDGDASVETSLNTVPLGYQTTIDIPFQVWREEAP